MKNTWPGGYRHAITQDEHTRWNNSHYPGTRQLCCKCEEPTGNCEEDALYTDDEIGPLCETCYDFLEEQNGSKLSPDDVTKCTMLSGEDCCQACGILWKDHHQHCEGSSD